MSLTRVGLAYNPTKESAIVLRDRAAAWLAGQGIASWSATAEDRPTLDRELAGTDLLIVLGGDGTFLRAVVAVAGTGVPVLGVNLGKVGFLSKVEERELEAVLEQLAMGEYEIEERMALTGRILPGGRDADSPAFFALNDVVIARGALARVCRLDVSIGSSHLATFIADGLVVSTPTGSTGYSFSAGGPILDPTSRNLVVTPIAGYLSALRSVVIGPSQVVSCRVIDAHEALVSVDGREDLPIAVGDVVVVSADPRPVRFVEPRGRVPFWDLVRRKVELLPS